MLNIELITNVVCYIEVKLSTIWLSKLRIKSSESYIFKNKMYKKIVCDYSFFVHSIFVSKIR